MNAEFMTDADGRRLYDGKLVEIETATSYQAKRLGQIVGDEPDDNGVWTYRYIDNDMCDSFGLAHASKITCVKHSSRQTEAARVTRRALRARGFRIKQSWSDGLVKMERDDVWVSIRLDGTIGQIGTQKTFDMMAELIGAGFRMKGMS